MSMILASRKSRMQRKNKLQLGIISFCLGLAACGNDGNHSELKKYVNRVKARRSSQIDPIPEVKMNKKYEFPNVKRRSPFVAVAQKATMPGSGPDQKRPKQPLENYMLDSLKMVGTLERDEQRWAIIATPDGLFYRVRIGHYIGQNFGKIAKVTDKEVILEETIQVDGSWKKRSAKLSLVEGSA